MEKISEQIVAALPTPAAGNRLYYFSHARLQRQTCPVGFAVRVTASGSRSFVYFHRTNGRAHVETIGRHTANFSVLDAIIKAQEREEEIRNGGDPLPARTKTIQEKAKPKELTVGELLDDWIKRRVMSRLRSAKVIKQGLDRMVQPCIGHINVRDLKRSDISRVLNKIADENGEVQADRVLSYIRTALNWHELHGGDDTFRTPIPRGMARVSPGERAKKRILDDTELRDLWAALEIVKAPACFPPLVKTILLTACRRSEVARMHTSELTGDLWTIPGSRYKTGLDHVVPLTIGTMQTKPFIFSTTGGTVAFANFSKSKAALDRAIAVIRERDGREPMPRWTLHDLRRTARSLMSRAKVPSDYAERCLGHAIPGIRGIYDKYEYLDEKREAFDKLAAMVAGIVLDKVQ